MDDSQKITRVKTLLDNDAEATNDLIMEYLLQAREEILNRLYPYDYDGTAEVPARYENLECQLAVRYFLRRGAEGEISHNENGISRTYESTNDEDLLSEVVPFAGL